MPGHSKCFRPPRCDVTLFGKGRVSALERQASSSAGSGRSGPGAHDAGAAGTAGLTEDTIDPADARVINTLFTAFLVTPADPSKTRFNIGVRSGFAGAALTAVLRDTNGVTIRTVTKTYQPNWFEQVDSTSFFGGTAIGGNESIAITVTSGSAIVYGSTTDNTTNDPNIQFATALFGVA